MQLFEDQNSFKTFESVYLKATYDIDIGGINFKEGETIALFDKIQISGFNELREHVAARGGYGNRAHVYWDTTREINLTFSQGVFSNLQFGILNNSKIINISEEEPILITKVEELEIDQTGFIQTSEPFYDQIFVYSKETGEKVKYYKYNDKLLTDFANLDVVVSYRYAYKTGGSIARIGQPLLNGFLELEGKTRVKDDTSGLITTGIIKIPKLKLMSDLSIRLGTQVNPVVGNFKAVCVPVGTRRDSYVAEFCFLENDIDSDM